ncbi:MAG: sulfatase [Planctomycetota bacterium]|nr:MAG: sulfatase [Planctomycetota bacterium]
MTHRIGILFCLAIVFLSVCSNVYGFEEPKYTNVIIIYADDLGWGDLACFGHPEFKTPNIDRLAAEGARLTNFYSTYPYCAPARASLQTGRYAIRTGVVRNPCPDAGQNDIGIPASEITLGEAFKAAGYRTICIGKWHLGHRTEFFPIRNGYDEYLGILYSNDMHPVELIDGDKVVEYPVVQATLTKRYTERALDFIERNKNRPFFIYFPHAMPHKPLAASERFYKKTGTGLYGDVITEIDWSVGRIIDRLKILGLDEQTLVFFTSDNGPWYGGSTGGLRGMKGRTWEGGIRVPLIARWPGKIPPGHVSRQPAVIVDLYTTALNAAGIDEPKDRIIDGKNIMPLLTSKAQTPHEAIFSYAGDRLRTVRSGKWKLHLKSPGPKKEKVWKSDDKWADRRAPDGVRIIAPFEQAHPSQYPGVMTGDVFAKIGLFDLEGDPAEQHDLAEQNPDIVEKLKAMAEKFMESTKPAAE